MPDGGLEESDAQRPRPDIADARGFLDPEPPSSPTAERDPHRVRAPQSALTDDQDQGYEVEESPVEAASVPRPAAFPTDDEAKSPRAARSRSWRSRPDLDEMEEGAVEETWSRWREAAPDLIRVGLTGLTTLVLAYFSFSVENLSLSLTILIVGGLAAVILAYPIWITLERPVRITPEQAARDYYDSLCHHLPHFRRMWLLLGKRGRTCGAYGSFEGFRDYWKRRLETLRDGQVGPWTPLVFQVTNFRSEKSGGQSRLDVEFVVQVWRRGGRAQPPLRSIPVQMSMVRGPDRMWYLESGVLAE